MSIDGCDFGCLPTQNKLNICNVDVDVGHIDIDVDFNVGHSRAAACAEFEICVWTRKSPLLAADISLHTFDISLHTFDIPLHTCPQKFLLTFNLAETCAGWQEFRDFLLP